MESIQYLSFIPLEINSCPMKLFKIKDLVSNLGKKKEGKMWVSYEAKYFPGCYARRGHCSGMSEGEELITFEFW